MASTYVQITREEFEQWLATLSSVGSKGWARVPGRAGMYLVHLSDLVSILVLSSIGNNDAAMAKDKGTMSMRLVARDNFARTLNKKAVAKKYNRTTNWRTNLAKGIKIFRDTYITDKGFYDHLAEVKDLLAYQKEWRVKLDKVPGSKSNPQFIKYRETLDKGYILSIRQEGDITEALAAETLDQALPSATKRPQVSLGPPPELVAKIQSIYDALGWKILKSFLDQLHQGRFLTDVQMETVDKAERAAKTSRPAPIPTFSPDPGIIPRLEELHKLLDNTFTKSLLDQARQRALSPAQMSRVVEMEQMIAKGRARLAPAPALPTQAPSALKLLEELEDDEASLRQQRFRSFMSKGEYDRTVMRANQNRDELMGIITTMGRAAQGEDRMFLRKVFSDLRGSEELDDATYDRLRRMVGVPARSAHHHIRFVDIPHVA